MAANNLVLYNFSTSEAPRDLFLVSKYMFSGSRKLIRPFTMTLAILVRAAILNFKMAAHNLVLYNCSISEAPRDLILVSNYMFAGSRKLIRPITMTFVILVRAAS